MPRPHHPTRRDFVKASATAATAALAFPMFVPASVLGQAGSPGASDRISIGFIGVGSRGGSHVDGLTGRKEVEAVAACDVDQNYLGRAKKTIEEKNGRLGRTPTCDTYARYEDLIARNDIDAVVITTPDHWHTKIAIEAMKSGKDVYCEKPLTLTIDEGKLICKVVKETGRVFQVGTQQRSGRQFLEAIALVRNGHLGKLLAVNCSIGSERPGGPFKKEAPPAELDWERWQGQTPLVAYIKERCHYQFRWWYEYSGGKMTDWGAHHVDIATWGMSMENSGPVAIEPVAAAHPVPFEKGYPTVDDCYNTATAFNVKCTYADGVELTIRHDGRNGITFTGEKGEIFVDRGRRSGAFEKKEENPLSPDDVVKLYGDDKIDHYQNFIHAIQTRKQPVSDVFSHHRALTTCHLANIAIRLGRPLKWDPASEQIIGDDEANKWVKREQRAGYEINA